MKLCPICETETEEFLPFAGEVGKRQRRAKCQCCGSLERHRLVWLYFRHETDLFDAPKRMLHIAPEPALFQRLRSEPRIDYVCADLNPTYALDHIEAMDVMSIPYPEDSFDVIYCSHVLEHVEDDRRAMREFARVLRPDGWAVLLVPVLRPVTDEDPSVTDPAERSRRFGQSDHLRMYGPDFADRLREAGFEVTTDPYPTRIPDSERYGLMDNDLVFFARPAQA